MRLPEAKDEVNYNSIKWRRWNFATHDSGRARPDFRPRNFMKVMRWEILVVCGGIFMGLMLPKI